MSPVVRLLLALSLAAAACFSPAAYALDTGDIVVTSIKGEVHVTVNGADRALKPGAVLDTPAAIRTGRDGAIELKQGATTVSVGPDTELEFPAQEKRGGAIDRIVQPRGNAFYSIGKREGRKLRVETPYLVGVIKGTQFNVAAHDGATTISLFEGRLEVHATDESDVIDLNAGEIATRQRGEKSIDVMKMDQKVPNTAPRPSSSGGNGGSGVPGPAPRSPRGDDTGATLLAGDVPDANASSNVGAPSATNVSASVDVRTSATDVSTPASADTNATVSAGASADPNEVNAGGNLGVATPGAAVDAGATVNVSAPAATIDAAAGVSVNTGVSVDVSTGANVAPLGTEVTNTTSINVTPAVDVTVGSTGVAVDASASSAVDSGPLAAGVGSSTAVDVGTSGVSAAVDAGANVAVGTTPIVDTSTSAAVDLGASTAAAVDTSANVAGVDTGVAAAVNATAGTVDLGLGVGGVNVNVGVDLGLDDDDDDDDGNNGHGNNEGHNDPSNPGHSGPPATTPVVDVGGLLDGLVRHRRK